MTEIRQIPNTYTAEGASTLETQNSGSKDGKIAPSIWNESVEDHGEKNQGASKIKDDIKWIRTSLSNVANKLSKIFTTYSAASIKVTIPPAYMSKEAKNIIEHQQGGVKLRETLKKGDTIGITKYNVAQAAIAVNFGPHSQQQAKFVYNKLKARYDELYAQHFKTTEQEFMKLSCKEQNKLIHEVANSIIEREKFIVDNSKATKEVSNKFRPEVQKCFDNANKALVDAANNKGKLKINKTNYGSKRANLPDGRWIEVFYDKGTISEIRISYNSTPDVQEDESRRDDPEVIYSENEAEYNIDHNQFYSEGSITSGYNFKKLKAIATSIFD